MTIQQSHFRIRNIGAEQTINQDSDWAGDLDVDATLDADVIHGGLLFGLRVELEEIVASSTTITPKLQYRIDAGSWADCYNETYTDPNITLQNGVVSIVDKVTIADAAATTNILGGSGLGFVAGTGSHTAVSSSVTLDNQHTELEWRILVHTLSSSPTARSQEVTGAEFEFRVVESDNTLLGGTYVIPKITLNVPDGYIGGTAVETSANFQFIQIPATGTFYMLQEDGETEANIVMLKSLDGGDTWLTMTEGIELAQNDMESVSYAYDDSAKVIHILHVGGSAEYYQYATEDHATETPDSFLVGVITVSEQQLNASIDSANQTAELILRGSTLYAFYSDLIGTDQVVYRKKPDLSTTDNWAAEVSIDTEGGSSDFAGVAAVLGPNSDLIHMFYTDYSQFILWHRSLNTSDTLGDRHSCDTDQPQSNDGTHNMTNAISWYNGSVEKAMVGYAGDANEYLWTVTVEEDAAADARQNASNSVRILVDPASVNARQPVATIGVDTNTDIIYAFYALDADADLWRSTSADGASWAGHTEELDGVIVHAIRGQVLIHGAGIHGGNTVFGYIREAQYNQLSATPKSGYTGTNRYDELLILEGATDVDDRQPAYTEGLSIFPFTESFAVGGDGAEWRRSHWQLAETG